MNGNIAGFGGDPTRVLLGGQSAGGGQVAATLASPMAGGLFARALVESGFYSARTLSSTPTRAWCSTTTLLTDYFMSFAAAGAPESAGAAEW